MKKLAFIAALFLASEPAFAVPSVQWTDQNGVPQGTAAAPLSASTVPYSGPAGACASTTVGTGATQILAANGPRNGGGFKVPSNAAQGVYYSWNSATPGTTEGGTTFYAAPGSTVPFAGAPSNALTAQAAASTVIACFTE